MTDAPPPWPLGACWTLFARERTEPVERVRVWADKARLFLRAELWLADATRDGLTGLDVVVDPKRAGETVRVRVYGCALEHAPRDVVDAAARAVRAMGGAGFDVLMARATWCWQVEARERRAAMVVSAAIAMVDLAPALEPGGGAIMGVKGLRERLDKG